MAYNVDDLQAGVDRVLVKGFQSQAGVDIIDGVGNALKVRESPMFGEPTLESSNNGCAVWARGGISPLGQKGSTGWLANLWGGIQTGDDWARVDVPVNEMPITDLVSAMWTYYMDSAQTMGVNMVIWVHDPDDFSKRAEITQLANIATLEKASGWNKHILAPATEQFFFYGEGTTGTDLTAGPPNYYSLEDFQADILFKNWTIYRITFEYGWEASGTFEDVWVADIKINGQMIPLRPDSNGSGSGRIGIRYFEGSATSFAKTLAPKTPFRLLKVDLKIDIAGTTDEDFTITKDAGISDTYDVLLLTQNTKSPAITSLFLPFGIGYEFAGYDEIDFAWPNTEERTIGLTVAYQTVFP